MKPVYDQPATQHTLPNGLVQYDLCKTHYDLALARQARDLPRVFGLLLHLARTYTEVNQYVPAIGALEQALSMARLAANRHQEGHVLCTLAGVYQASGESDSALVHYRRALTIAEEMGNPHLKTASLDGLRRAKTALMVETLNRQPESLLPPTIAPLPDLDATERVGRHVLLAVSLFTVVFFLLPIALSQAGISDSLVALIVVSSSIVSLVAFWRGR